MQFTQFVPNCKTQTYCKSNLSNFRGIPFNTCYNVQHFLPQLHIIDEPTVNGISTMVMYHRTCCGQAYFHPQEFTWRNITCISAKSSQHFISFWSMDHNQKQDSRQYYEQVNSSRYLKHMREFMACANYLIIACLRTNLPHSRMNFTTMFCQKENKTTEHKQWERYLKMT